jgi:leader peptidase (prepilin peptidase)/N-methyltransferase
VHDLPPVYIVLLLTLSLFVGSFLGLLVERLPYRQSIIEPRSRCRSCGTSLRLADLVPLVSYLGLGGRCRSCRTTIPLGLPMIELASCAIMVWSLATVPPALLMPTVLLGWSLLALAIIDARHFLLPDVITLPLLVAGCITSLWRPELASPLHLVGALAGLSVFAAIRWAFYRIRGFEGLGWGDVKLFGAAGAWLGIGGLPNTLLIGAVTGLAFALLRDRGLNLTRAVPFGTFLCVGIWLTWLYGPIVPGF